MILANILQPLINFFEAILKFFHDSVGLGWGTAIVLLTLIVRAALLPLTLRQFKSMQAMSQLQPEIKALQAKHKGNREQLNQEMMKFYRENKVNPLSSCLPIIAQLPVFLALFYMLQKDLRLDICPDINPAGTTNPIPCGANESSGFLFIPDLTDKATGTVLVVLVILYVATQLFSSLLSTATMERSQRLLMLGLPFFFIVIIWQFPAGLLLYWITTNAWTIVQQAIVKKRLGPMRPVVEGADTGGFLGLRHLISPPPKPAGSGSTLVAELREAREEGKAKRSAEKAAKRSGDTPIPATAPQGKPAGPPPASPRKKKKRSGRRR